MNAEQFEALVTFVRGMASHYSAASEQVIIDIARSALVEKPSEKWRPTIPMCGFDDIRKDERGYFCSKCERRMPNHFLEMVSRQDLVKLNKQCAGK